MSSKPRFNQPGNVLKLEIKLIFKVTHYEIKVDKSNYHSENKAVCLNFNIYPEDFACTIY